MKRLFVNNIENDVFHSQDLVYALMIGGDLPSTSLNGLYFHYSTSSGCFLIDF